MKKLIVLLLLLLLLVSQILPWDAAFEVHTDQLLQPPSAQHLLGTDNLGRDYLSRLLLGFSNSLLIILSASLLTALLGFTYGLVAALVRGPAHNFLLAALDVVAAIPHLALIILLAVLFQEANLHGQISAALGVIFALSLAGWPWIARVVRGEVLRLKNEEFIFASQAFGGGPLHILRYQMWPHMKPLFYSILVFQIPAKVMMENLIGLIGVGLPAPAPSLGKLLAESWGYLRYSPQLMLAPALLIVIICRLVASSKFQIKH